MLTWGVGVEACAHAQGRRAAASANGSLAEPVLPAEGDPSPTLAANYRVGVSRRAADFHFRAGAEGAWRRPDARNAGASRELIVIEPKRPSNARAEVGAVQ
jgi:hypothetical protein